MEATRPYPRDSDRTILLVRHVPESLFVTFDDGTEFVYPARVLYDVVPKDELLAERIRRLLS